MKFTILQKELLEGLSSTARAVASRAQMPILSTILIRAKLGGVELMATDLELSVTTKVFGKVEEEGMAAVPAKTLLDLVASREGGKITFELVKETLTIISEGYKGKIQVMAAEEFPSLPQVPENGGVSAKGDDLSKTIGKVVWAAARDLLRPVLTGVHIELEKNYLKLVATDGFRLAVAKLPATLVGESASSLVPARALAEVARIAGDKAIRLVPVTTNQVGIVGDAGVITTQTIEGAFPDYNKIIPTEFVTTVAVQREDLESALKTVQIFARDNSNMVKWKIVQGEIVMSATAAERGEAEARVEAKVEGEGGEIVFNTKYIMDFLQNSKAQTIKFSMNGGLKPGLFSEEGNDDYMYVVMPINNK